MFNTQGVSLKRRAGDDLQGDSDAPEVSKRGRFDKVATSTSLTDTLLQGQTYLSNHPTTEASSNFSSPAGAPEQGSAAGFASMGPQFWSPEPQISAGSTGFKLSFSGSLPAGGWVRQPSLPGCSDSSEQTMEDVQSTPRHPVQVWSAEYRTPPWAKQPSPQRSNSAPDLRVLLSGPINPLPSSVLSSRPLQSSSPAGALVPFKAPEEVVEDAVRHMLKAGLGEAIQKRKAERVAANAVATAAEKMPVEMYSDQGEPVAMEL